MNDLTKNLLLWVVVAIVLMVVFQSFSPRDGATATAGEAPTYTRFLQDVLETLEMDTIGTVAAPCGVVGNNADGGIRQPKFAG